MVTRVERYILHRLCMCHTRFCKQNQVLILGVSRIIYSTHTDIKCSQVAKCHE
jgi:hypothetical protein